MESQNNSKSRFIFYILYFTFFISSCGIEKQINRSGQRVVNDSSLLNAHIGISIYEPATGKYWYNYNGEKYFVPASNTKIPTCYAAMKYLGDSLVGLRYVSNVDSEIYITPTGDPTFLHSDFKKQPVLEFLKQKNKTFYFSNHNWEDAALGSGWSWNDYNSSFMAERSAFPLNGNLVDFNIKSLQYIKANPFDFILSADWVVQPSYFKDSVVKYYDLPLKESVKKEMYDSVRRKLELRKFSIQRSIGDNHFSLIRDNSNFIRQSVPFYTNDDATAIRILREDNSIKINSGGFFDSHRGIGFVHEIHSQPTDSLLKPMMHRSDNFFAEQCLLMVSNEMLGIMNDAKIIDTLLKTDLKDLPQKPRWVDGSGLSRYNLFTPQDFVVLLNKMKTEFGMNRIKEIFPTGGEGTISSYYKTDSGYIYAKTGTLSGVVALSGYLTTKKNKELIFSVLVNNHQASATAVRRAVEKLIQGLRDKY